MSLWMSVVILSLFSLCGGAGYLIAGYYFVNQRPYKEKLSLACCFICMEVVGIVVALFLQNSGLAFFKDYPLLVLSSLVFGLVSPLIGVFVIGLMCVLAFFVLRMLPTR